MRGQSCFLVKVFLFKFHKPSMPFVKVNMVTTMAKHCTKYIQAGWMSLDMVWVVYTKAMYLASEYTKATCLGMYNMYCIIAFNQTFSCVQHLQKATVSYALYFTNFVHNSICTAISYRSLGCSLSLQFQHVCMQISAHEILLLNGLWVFAKPS